MSKNSRDASWLSKTYPEIYAELKDVLTEKGISQWLRAKHRLLGGKTALEVLERGDVEIVKETAVAYTEGTYI